MNKYLTNLATQKRGWHIPVGIVSLLLTAASVEVWIEDSPAGEDFFIWLLAHIFLMMKTKIQAFLALILCTITVGVIGGMPLIATDIVDAAGQFKSGVSIVNSITGGFGSTLGSIGIIIGFGVMIGQIFEVSGAAKRMAYTFLKLSAKERKKWPFASGAVSPMLGAVACCVGSLFFSYFNDSYFWVVNRTLGVSEAKEQLRVWSVTSTIAWLVGVIEVLVLSVFMR